MTTLTEKQKELLYDMERNGTLYVKTLRAEIDAAPDRDTKSRLILRMADQILADDLIAILEEIDGGESEPRTSDDIPFGQLRDGTLITSVYDEGEPNGRCGIIHATVGDWYLTAQDEPALLSIHGDLSFEDVTLDDINALRAFLATDIPEQMIAAAVANGKGLDAPVFDYDCHPRGMP